MNRFTSWTVSIATIWILGACGAPSRCPHVVTAINEHAGDFRIEQANKLLARRYYEEIISTGDVDALPEFIALDYVEVHDGVTYELGIEGAKEHILGVRTTYPDLTVTVERQIAEGEWVASVVTARGTHHGVWLNMTPTNRPVTITAVNVDRVVNGRIVQHSGAANLLGPLLEVGAIKVAQPVVDAAGE